MSHYRVVIEWPADKPGLDTWRAFSATVDGQTLRCSARREGDRVTVEYPCEELLLTHLALMQSAAATSAAPPRPASSGRQPATKPPAAGDSLRAASDAASSWTSAPLPGTEPTDLERRTATGKRGR